MKFVAFICIIFAFVGLQKKVYARNYNTRKEVDDFQKELQLFLNRMTNYTITYKQKMREICEEEITYIGNELRVALESLTTNRTETFVTTHCTLIVNTDVLIVTDSFRKTCCENLLLHRVNIAENELKGSIKNIENFRLGIQKLFDKCPEDSKFGQCIEKTDLENTANKLVSDAISRRWMASDMAHKYRLESYNCFHDLYRTHNASPFSVKKMVGNCVKNASAVFALNEEH